MKATIVASRKLILVLIIFFLFQSCYSVRMVSTMGVPEPDPMNNEDGFYRNKQVTVLKETVPLNILEEEFTLLEKCGERGFHSIEYRNTFGGLLLSTITLGKKRRVLVKYVCIKEEN